MEKHPGYFREAMWKHKGIKITLDEYDQMLQKQNGVCAICGETDPLRSLAVDHDHKTGKIRGLLCTRCNRWIVAMLDKHPSLVAKAQIYLEG